MKFKVTLHTILGTWMRFAVAAQLFFVAACQAGAFSGTGRLEVRIAGETNQYQVDFSYRNGLGYTEIGDQEGPLEITLDQKEDTLIWKRGSQSWDLYIVPTSRLQELNPGDVCNQLGGRIHRVLKALSGEADATKFDLSRFESQEFKWFSSTNSKVLHSTSQRIGSGEVQYDYFDIWSPSDGDYITNLSGTARLKLEPLRGRDFNFALDMTSCSSSKVFTNVMAEFRLKLAGHRDLIPNLALPPPPLNHGMVLDYRGGVKRSYSVAGMTGWSHLSGENVKRRGWSFGVGGESATARMNR